MLAPMAPFVVPTHPGTLRAPMEATQYQAALANKEHDEALHTFQSYQLIQRALVQQALETIETKCLSSIQNRITG